MTEMNNIQREHINYLMQHAPTFKKLVEKKLREDEWLFGIILRRGYAYRETWRGVSIEEEATEAQEIAIKEMGLYTNDLDYANILTWLKEWPCDWGIRALREEVEQIVTARLLFTPDTRNHYNDCYVRSGFLTHNAFMQNLLAIYERSVSS